MLKIGYILNSYPEKRCIIDKTNNEYVHYSLKRSFSFLIKAVLLKLGVYIPWDVMSYVRVPSGRVDVWHTFNEVPRTKDPFLITFESAVPRNSETLERKWEWDDAYEQKVSEKTKRQIQYLSQNNCKRLLALSQNTADIMCYQFGMFAVEPEVSNAIMDKVEVLYPPQALNCTVQKVNNKYKSGTRLIEFVFVGNDFFRKGGGYVA